MAAARNCRATTLTVAATVILIASLTFPPHISVGDESTSSSRVEEIRKKGVLGSRPPGCLNKCMNCRPCETTLVVPPHPMIIGFGGKGYNHQSSHRDDDSYYLLSWKCTCGDKLFQP